MKTSAVILFFVGFFFMASRSITSNWPESTVDYQAYSRKNILRDIDLDKIGKDHPVR